MADQSVNQTMYTSAVGTPSFKLSDILNVGELFGGLGAGKGAKRTGAINDIADAGFAGTMSYLAADKTGSNKLQTKAKTIDAGFDALASGVSMLPGVGPVAGLALQGLQLGMKHLAPKIHTLPVNKDIGSSSAYGGLASSIGNQNADIKAYNAAGVGKFSMSRSKMKSDLSELSRQQSVGVGVLRNNKKLADAAGNNANYLNFQNNINFAGGLPSVPVGKNGLNTDFLIKRRALKLQNGGAINVVVDGKLHSQLNHMEDVVDIPITPKGVPVTVVPKEGEGGAIEQAAELERDEIILHVQLTKKLEELAKEDTEESMIEAGKILAKEILKNTKDSKSKLLKTVV